MKYPFSRVFGASLVALTLAGCGSKENSDESPAQIIETAEEDKSIYQGVDTPVSIDQGNAETLARVLLSGSNDTPRTSVALQAKAQSVSKQLNSTNSGKTSNTYSALTEITTQSEANEPVVEVIYGSISGTNTVEDYAKGAKTGIVKFTFDEFNNGNGETVYGKLEYNAIVYDPTFELVTESTYTYNEMRTETYITDKVAYGTYKSVFDTETGTQTITADLLINNLIRADSIRLEGLATEVSVAGKTENDEYVFSETISGRIYISNLGYIDIETLSPLYCIKCSASEYLPSGSIQVRGAGGSNIIISVLENKEVQAMLDEDGDGSYESALTYSFNTVGL